MSRLRTVLFFLLCWVLAYVLVQLSRWWHRPPSEEPAFSAAYAARLAAQRDRLRPDDGGSFDPDEHRGRVLVVCAAGVKAPEVESWLGELAELYREGLPEAVEVVWLAVGSEEGEVAEAARRWSLPFPAHGDPAGAVAERLNHWVGPALYVVGKWGAVRYSGRLPRAGLRRMLLLLAEEVEDGDHSFFSRQGADIEHRAPDFVLPDLEGDAVALYSLVRSAQAVCLVFVGAELKRGAESAAWLDGLIKEKGPAQVRACVVYSGVSPEAVRGAYGQLPEHVTVLCDESGEVARAFRFEIPPLVLVLNARGTIRYRAGALSPVERVVSTMLRRLGSVRPPASRRLPP